MVGRRLVSADARGGGSHLAFLSSGANDFTILFNIYVLEFFFLTFFVFCSSRFAASARSRRRISWNRWRTRELFRCLVEYQDIGKLNKNKNRFSFTFGEMKFKKNEIQEKLDSFGLFGSGRNTALLHNFLQSPQNLDSLDSFLCEFLFYISSIVLAGRSLCLLFYRVNHSKNVSSLRASRGFVCYFSNLFSASTLVAKQLVSPSTGVHHSQIPKTPPRRTKSSTPISRRVDSERHSRSTLPQLHCDQHWF